MTKIILIDEFGTNLGETEFAEANEIAKERDKKLLMVNKERQIYKIMDIGKMRYDQKQRDKKKRAQQRANKIKEIQLRPSIDQHDLQIKVNHIKEFVSSGFKTRMVMKFRKQQMAYKSFGMQKVNGIVEDIVNSVGCETDCDPKFEGNSIRVTFIPSKKIA